MNDAGLIRLYDATLRDVGQRAGEIGDRQIACHWPFVGSQFSGTLIVGQALDGWDAEETTARWPMPMASREEGRLQIINGARAWAAARPEPMDEVLRWGHRRGSPFWNLSMRVMRLLEARRQALGQPACVVERLPNRLRPAQGRPVRPIERRPGGARRIDVLGGGRQP